MRARHLIIATTAAAVCAALAVPVGAAAAPAPPDPAAAPRATTAPAATESTTPAAVPRKKKPKPKPQQTITWKWIDGSTAKQRTFTWSEWHDRLGEMGIEVFVSKPVLPQRWINLGPTAMPSMDSRNSGNATHRVTGMARVYVKPMCGKEWCDEGPQSYTLTVRAKKPGIQLERTFEFRITLVNDDPDRPEPIGGSPCDPYDWDCTHLPPTETGPCPWDPTGTLTCTTGPLPYRPPGS